MTLHASLIGNPILRYIWDSLLPSNSGYQQALKLLYSLGRYWQCHSRRLL